MTAADALFVQPAARPEPSVAKAAAPREKGQSFADVLDVETAQSIDDPAEVAAKESSSTDAIAVPLATQPVPPPAQPTAASPAAILAGFNPIAENVDGLAEAQPSDGATPAANLEIATAAPGPAPATMNASAAQTAGLADDTAAIAEQQAGAPSMTAKTQSPAAAPSKSAARKDGDSDADDQASEPAEMSASDEISGTAQTKPATPGVSTQQFLAAGQPAAVSTTDRSAQPASAPGAERAAAAVESVSSSKYTAEHGAKSASTGADNTAQTAAAKAAQPTANAADMPTDIKPSTASGLTSVPVAETLTAARASGAEAGKTAQSSLAAQTAPSATIQVYSRMIERFDGRAQRFEIRLDPAELGRVDVRIEVGADKKVHAVLAAHDSAALTDLMRGQRALEASLRQAGIDVADGGIKFELSNDTGYNASNGASQGETNRNGQGSGNVWRNFSTVDLPADANVAAAARPWRASRLDLVA